jgi:hypothetical protein
MAPDDTPCDDPPVDPTVPDSAMDTGSDDGEPGDRSEEGPLTGDERALLERLTHHGSAGVVTQADEDSPAFARAVAEGTTVPDPDVERGGPDPDTPQFRDAPGG